MDHKGVDLCLSVRTARAVRHTKQLPHPASGLNLHHPPASGTRVQVPWKQSDDGNNDNNDNNVKTK